MRLMQIKSYNKKISKFIFTLRNKNYVRNNSITIKKIQLSDHEKWFDSFLKRKNILYLICKGNFFIGYVRLEKLKEHFNVSWAILKKYQKKGFAKKSLRIATKSKKFKYKALIKKNNLASVQIAKKAGFQRKCIRKNIYYYSK